jgi:peptide deformylase
MTIREIITFPDPRLKIKAKKVTSFDKDLHLLIDDMIETMREAPGVGLAAPQLGISEKIFVKSIFSSTLKLLKGLMIY